MEEDSDLVESSKDDSSIELSTENITSDETIRSTKKPLEDKASKSAKRHKVEHHEDVLIKKAIECLEKPNDPIEKDPDDQFIISELKSIKDEHQKRMIKFNIQSVFLYSALSPQPPYNHPYYGQYYHPNWEDSRSPTSISDKSVYSFTPFATSSNAPSSCNEEDS